MKRYRIITSFAAGAALFLSLQSCTVKEERVECPCWLSVCLRGADNTNPETQHRNLTVTEWNQDNLIRRETVDVDDYMESPYYEKTVDRGMVTIAVHSPKSRMTTDGRLLTIERGEQCDSIFAYSSTVDCTGESASDSVTLHKQFAMVCVRMQKPDTGAYPFKVRARGFFKGLDITTLEPVAGGYEYTPEAQGEDGNIFFFRVPRQRDSSLLLDIYDGDSIEGTVEIGKTITGSGYSWYSIDLDDIVLDVDFSLAKVSDITIIPWEEGFYQGLYQF